MGWEFIASGISPDRGPRTGARTGGESKVLREASFEFGTASGVTPRADYTLAEAGDTFGHAICPATGRAKHAGEPARLPAILEAANRSAGE